MEMGVVWLHRSLEETLDMPMPLIEHLYQMEIDRQNWIAGRPFQFKTAPGKQRPTHRDLSVERFDALFGK